MHSGVLKHKMSQQLSFEPTHYHYDKREKNSD